MTEGIFRRKLPIIDTAHRPWPIPTTRPAMDMSWHDLLFMHWPVKADQLRSLIPESLRLETFEGEAWIGVVPFRMTRVKPYRFPSLPGCSAFPELNVRTYVTDGERSGVWFFSLDAANPVAVAVARRFYHLPYFHARMSLTQRHDGFEYRSLRTHRHADSAGFEASYRPSGIVTPADSLAAWLTDRYCLYAVDRQKRLWRTNIHHPRWPLQPAEVEVKTNTMTDPINIKLPDMAPLVHFAGNLEVVAWKPQWVSG